MGEAVISVLIYQLASNTLAHQGRSSRPVKLRALGPGRLVAQGRPLDGLEE